MNVGADEETRMYNYNKWSRLRGRNYHLLKAGDKILYCLCPIKTSEWGMRVDRTPQPLVEYTGEVIQKTPYHITLEIAPREGQISNYGKSKPYKFSISRSDVGVTNIIRKIAQND